jgi:hypothetical protein
VGCGVLSVFGEKNNSYGELMVLQIQVRNSRVPRCGTNAPSDKSKWKVRESLRCKA